jgi:hypothetical protein
LRETFRNPQSAFRIPAYNKGIWSPTDTLPGRLTITHPV